MIDLLKRLLAVREKAKTTPLLKKASVAEEAADISIELFRVMATEIIQLKQEVAKWKPQQ